MHTEGSFQIALIDEARHRHANEFAAALASLHLLKAKMAVHDPLIDGAIGRLDNAVRLERHLLDCGTPDLYPAMLRLCTLLRLTRPNEPRFRLHFRDFPRIPNPSSMRLVLLVVYELLVNATKHTSAEKTAIGVRLHVTESEIRLSISNPVDGLSARPNSSRGGLAIARSVSSELGGDVSLRHYGRRLIATASFPFLLDSRNGSGEQASAG